MHLPAEVRARITNEYLDAERSIEKNVDQDKEFKGGLVKAIHHDNFGRRCCVWKWPQELTICDKATADDLTHILFPRWLPNLALTSRAMRG